MSRFKVGDIQDGCTKCPKIEGVRGKKVYEYFADGSDDMEHKIGEIVTLLDGRKAEVVETKHNSCGECMFCNVNEEYDCGDVVGINCSEVHRSDHKNIIYKEVKEE